MLAVALAALSVVALVGYLVDSRELLGRPLWEKPLKFAISGALYAVTWAWIIGHFTRWRRAAWWAGTVITVTLAIELVIIVGFAAAEQERVIPGRLTRRHGFLGECIVRVEQPCPFAEIFLFEETLDRCRHEIWIGQISFAVRKRQTLRIADQPPAFNIVRPEPLQIEVFENAQHLADGNATGGGRPHAAYIESAIGKADRFPLLDPVIGEIGQRENAGIALCLAHGLDDRLRNRAGIEGIGAAGRDRPQRFGIGRVLEESAGLQRCAAIVEEIADRSVIGLQLVTFGRKQRAEPRWILPMLCKAGDVTKTAIGSIRIFDTESIFEVAAPKADAFLRNITRNGSGERGVTITAVDGPGERPAGPPPSQRRPPGPIERYDPDAPRPERADRQARYGSAGLRPDDFEAPATGGWSPSGDAETPRPPRPDFDKPRAPKVNKAPPSKDKGKPKWAAKPADGSKPFKKDHKAKRKPQI